MEDINLSTETTEVNSTAATQSEVTVNTVDGTEGQATEANTEPSETVKSQSDDGFDGDKYAKAFSKRLNKEREKITAQYANHSRVIELAAKQFGMTAEDYINTVLKEYGATEDAKEEVKTEKDILLEELLNEKREKEIASEWNRQANALREINENVSIDEITDDMFQMAYDKNIPLEYVYAHHLLTAGRDSFTNSIKEQVMKNIEKVNKTAGSMSSNSVNTQAKSINSMNAKEFDDFKERVKRGEIRDF